MQGGVGGSGQGGAGSLSVEDSWMMRVWISSGGSR